MLARLIDEDAECVDLRFFQFLIYEAKFVCCDVDEFRCGVFGVVGVALLEIFQFDFVKK